MSKEHKLKHSIYATAREIAKEATPRNLEIHQDSLDLIAELAWKKVSLYAADLEAFAKHAKRQTVSPDDVKLLVRRNESVRKILEEKAALKPGGNDGSSGSTLKRKRKGAEITT